MFIVILLVVVAFLFMPTVMTYAKTKRPPAVAKSEWPQSIKKPRWDNFSASKTRDAINEFINLKFQDKRIVHHESGRRDFQTWMVKIAEKATEGIELAEYVAKLSSITMNEAGNDFATRMGLINWGWKNFEKKIIEGFDEDNVYHEYFVDNWTDYIRVLSFENTETGEIIYNEPKLTPERDLAGYFANLVKINMPYFHLLSEKIANEGRVKIYADVLNEGKHFTKRELKALVNEIEGIGYSVVCDYVTGEMQIDFSDDAFDMAVEELE